MFLFLSTPLPLLIYHNKTLGIRTHTVSTTTTTTKKRRAVKPHIPRFTAQIADLAPAASAVYGTLLLGGGLFAYTRSKSQGSLLGGVSGAILMATAYFLMQVPETKDLGDALGFGSAFIFSSVFGIRLAATRKLIPAGPLLGLSVCALAVFSQPICKMGSNPGHVLRSLARTSATFYT